MASEHSIDLAVLPVNRLRDDRRRPCAPRFEEYPPVMSRQMPPGVQPSMPKSRTP